MLCLAQTNPLSPNNKQKANDHIGHSLLCYSLLEISCCYKRKNHPIWVVFLWRRRRDSKLHGNPSCGARTNLRGLRPDPRFLSTAAPTSAPCIRHRLRSHRLPAPFGARVRTLNFCKEKTTLFGWFFFGGEGGTRTLAPVTRPTPLAGAPRHQLEYFSIGKRFYLLLPMYYTYICCGCQHLFSNSGKRIPLFINKKPYHPLLRFGKRDCTAMN